MKLQNKFIIIVPVYNAQSYILPCIISILNQSFDDLGIIIRDDLSTDNTRDIIKNYFSLSNNQSVHNFNFKGRDIIYVENDNKLYPCGNTYESVLNFVEYKNSIIGVVDGDDKLIDNKAIEKIFKVYEEKKVWLVWSQHKPSSGQPGFSKNLPSDNEIYSSRNYWSVSHFRTSVAGLYFKIDKSDLIDPFDNLSYFKFCGDAAFLFPFIEMSGNEKSFFLNEVFYHYTDNAPLNEHNKDRNTAMKYGSFVRNNSKKYKKLQSIN